ncbi:MAG: glycosyltransferase [Cytophagaceae bacterium]|nr:glycosyltransferase [Gemmatimonadaceae bacterium]
MTLRTLFLNHSATVGGAEFGLIDLAAHLRDGALVVLLEDGPLRERLEERGVEVKIVDAGAVHRVRRGSMLPGAAALASLWRAGREVARIAGDFDVLHANSQKALVVGSIVAKRVPIPMVWQLHDIIERPWFSRTNILADVLLANHCAERVIAVSRATAESLVRHGGDASRVHVVYNGIDPAPSSAATGAGRDCRQELGLADVPVVGCFSRLAEWKGQHVVLEAMRELHGVHVLLVGGPLFDEHAYEARLRAYVREHGMEDRVHFLGHRRNVAELMRAVDLLVHPSTAPEPFARTLIEGMLAGHAPIASANGGVPELITHGETGYLFPPGDAVALRQLVARLLDDVDELARVSAQALEHAHRDFSLSAFVTNVESHLRAAAASRPAGAWRGRAHEVPA